jgi:ketosteroid isomerase-like protein
VDEQIRRRIHDAYAGMVEGDPEGLADVLHPEVEWVNPEAALEPGTRRGPEEFAVALGRLRDSFQFVELVPETLEEADDGRVLVLVRVKLAGRASGAPGEWRFGHLLTFRDGKLARFQWFPDVAEARAALARPPADTP